ncbi:MAG: RDD family protein, partial [Betaproteobacteria bacterium]
MTSDQAPTPTDLGPPNLALRVAAMIYESVLLFGIVFAAAFALLTLTGWTYPLSDQRRWVLQAVL